MSENKPIRSRFFGGFDRRDVVESIKRISDEKNAVVKERDVLKVQLKNATADRDVLKTRVDDLTADFDIALATADAALEAKNAELQAKIGEFDAFRAAETVKRFGFEQQIREMETSIANYNTLERFCAEVTAERDALAKECEAYASGIREVAAAHAAECDAFRRTIDELTFARDTALVELNATSAERDMAVAERNAIAAERDAFGQQLDAFRREIYSNTAKAISLHQAALDVMLSTLPDEAE